MGERDLAPEEHWEEMYSSSEKIWSGKPNFFLAQIASTLEPGKALDLGCGEGGDVIWLAKRGWDATGVDLSTTAINRAREAARSEGIPENRIRLLATDLTNWQTEDTFDLVSASFFQAGDVELARVDILRKVSKQVAPGGRLLVVTHGAPPPWAGAEHTHKHHFPSIDEELASLDMDPDDWETEVAEMRTRHAQAPNGEVGDVEDLVLVFRKFEA